MMITTTIQASDLLQSDYLHALRVILPSYQSVTLALVGCGGTGSWLAPAVARVGRLVQEKLAKDVRIAFIDPDRVEAKNVYRQNFCEAEVGQNKAEALAWRYGLAWGVEITAHSNKYIKARDELRGADLEILIGCVDNGKARQEIQTAVSSIWGNVWWLDCGNHQSAGQVLIGGGNGGERGANPLGLTERGVDPFGLPGYCSRLPLPSAQHPELVETSPLNTSPLTPLPGRERGAEGMSCADMAMVDSQGLAINQRVAAEAADYLVRLLLTRDLDRMATYIDLTSGSSRSIYITREVVESYWKGEKR